MLSLVEWLSVGMDVLRLEGFSIMRSLSLLFSMLIRE